MSQLRERLFPLLAGGLYLWFLLLDVTQAGDSTWIKFAAICLCLLVSLTGWGSPDGRLVAVAMVFTVAADWFLLVRDDHHGIGIGLFLAAQFLYAHRLYRMRGNRASFWGVRLRLGALLLVLLLAGLLVWTISVNLSAFVDAPEDVFLRLPSLSGLLLSALVLGAIPTALPALFYFANLCVNAAEAFALGREDPGARRFAWGLLLFVCCDLCVGGWNLGLLPGFTRVGMWLFYLPSQVLIVLSQEMKGTTTHEVI